VITEIFQGALQGNLLIWLIIKKAPELEVSSAALIGEDRAVIF